jgi:UDP-N-acetylglucosamine/UDP-N-acetylgalactosamine diphosphorylase
LELFKLKGENNNKGHWFLDSLIHSFFTLVAQRAIMVDLNRLQERYDAAQQSHVLAAIGAEDPTASAEEIQSFLSQLESIPVEKLASYLQTGRDQHNASSSHTEQQVVPFPLIDTPGEWPSSSSAPIVAVVDDPAVERRTRRNDLYRATGLKLIREGKVAAVILAGGQGTRLGYDGPKGCFDIGLPSKSTLFELICTRIKNLDDDATIPLVVMTAPHNDADTRAYFNQHSNFGLPSVQFCVQGMLPCMTDDDDNDEYGHKQNNKIILETPTRVALAPDGNGGIYQALHNDCHELLHQVDYIHVFSIDNALVLPCDPVFLGYAHHHDCYIANKCVQKVDPHEKVGVMALRTTNHKDGSGDDEPSPCVVEYSELSREMAESIDAATGTLRFGAANICNHLYRTDFIRTVVWTAPPTFHLAHKCIPYWNGTTTVMPTINNGYKLEQFIFDVFALCPVDRMKNFLVDRADEFAAVKNATGHDSPATALIALSERNKAWLRAAGAIVTGDGICEILHDCDASVESSLRERYAGVEIHCPVVLR